MARLARQETLMERALELLRSGDWLTRERVRLVAIALLIASAASLIYLVLTAHNGIDRQGRPLGTDFSNVYAAGTYVDEGKAAASFDPQQQFAREQAMFGADTQFYGWHYPPFFLFVAAALALIPYGVALAAWQAATLALYVLTIAAIVSSFRGPRSRNPECMIPVNEEQAPAGKVEAGRPRLWIRALARDAGPAGMTSDWLLLALAFPAVLINIGHGQNGFLTAALLGGALVMLDRRPILAGLLFGLLVYKPQYGVMIPLVLAVSGRWKCFAAAAVTVAVLALAATLAFGADMGRADSARLCGAGRRDHRDRRRADLALAQHRSPSAQSRGLVPLDHSRHALQLRLRHDGAGAGHRLHGCGRFCPRFRSLRENHARCVVAHAASRPQHRSHQSNSTRRAGNAGRVCNHIAAQRMAFSDGILRCLHYNAQKPRWDFAQSR